MSKEKSEKTADTATEQVNSAFTKEQWRQAKQYQSRKDLIDTLLEPEKVYTQAQVDSVIETYMKGRVK